MDGENDGQPYENWMIWGYHHFRKHPYLFKHFKHMPIPPPMGLAYFSLHEFLRFMVNAGQIMQAPWILWALGDCGVKVVFSDLWIY